MKGEFVWALFDYVALHAIDEQQVATWQDAMCGAAPSSQWGRATDDELDGVIPKCALCSRETRGNRDITKKVNRWVDCNDGEEEDPES